MADEEIKTEDKEYMVTIHMVLIGTYIEESMPSEATLRRQLKSAAEDKGRLRIDTYKFDLDKLRPPCKCGIDEEE